MLTDLQLAEICSEVYAGSKVWTDMCVVDGSYCVHEALPDCDVVCWRGSITALDWFEDLDARPIQTNNMGFVHAGFYQSVIRVYPTVRLWPSPIRKLYVIGHSLGAAHAMIFAGMLRLAGRGNMEVVVWGEPRPGFAELATVLWSTPSRSYRNQGDPVTEVPKFANFAGKDMYVHPKPLISVVVAPDPADLSPLRAHHFVHYLNAMKALHA